MVVRSFAVLVVCECAAIVGLLQFCSSFSSIAMIIRCAFSAGLDFFSLFCCVCHQVVDQNARLSLRLDFDAFQSRLNCVRHFNVLFNANPIQMEIRFKMCPQMDSARSHVRGYITNRMWFIFDAVKIFSLLFFIVIDFFVSNLMRPNAMRRTLNFHCGVNNTFPLLVSNFGCCTVLEFESCVHVCVCVDPRVI